MKPITSETLTNFPFENLVYAEYGELGGMGLNGQINCYVIENNELVRYQFDIDENNEDVFCDFIEAIQPLTDTTFYYYIAMKKVVPQIEKSILFYGIYGGMGTHTFFNRNFRVEVKDGHFQINIAQKTFDFKPSNPMIFNIVKPCILKIYAYLEGEGIG